MELVLGRGSVGMLKTLGAAILLLSAFAVAGPAEAKPKKNKGETWLLAPSDCARALPHIPDEARLPYKQAKSLADKCRSDADKAPLGATIEQVANSAHNAARLYLELARRTQSSPSEAANHLYAAQLAVTRSIEQLPDSHPGLVSAGDAAGLRNARYKHSRAAVLISTYLQRGLMKDSYLAGSCGGAVSCLQAGLNRFERSELAASSDPAAIREGISYDQLSILSARAMAELAPIMTSQWDINRALTQLIGVIERAKPVDPKGKDGIARDAVDTYVEIVMAQANQIKTKPADAPALRDVIRNLNEALRLVGRKELEISNRGQKLATIQRALADANFVAARLGGASIERSLGDYCNAIQAYQTVLDQPGLSLLSDQLIVVNENFGEASAAIGAAKDGTCSGGNAKAYRKRALDAFDRAWAERKRKGLGYNTSYARSHADLVSETGRTLDPAHQSALNLTSGVLSMETQLASAQDARRRGEPESVVVGFYKQAVRADAASPKPELELGKYYYYLADAPPQSADTGRLRNEAGRALAAAATKADRNSALFSFGAEANYYRSLNETWKLALPGVYWDSASAAQWAELAVQGNSAEPRFEYQACRVHLLRRSLPSRASAYCTANPGTAEGAVMLAMLRLREAQVLASTSAAQASGQWISSFRVAEDAFKEADNLRRSQQPSLQFSWPGEVATYDASSVISLGAAIARGCSTIGSGPPPAPPSGSEKAMKLFESYHLMSCK